jgi:hypothetical protein
MAVYLFGIKSISVGTAATGSNMPTGVALTALPDTVKGSVSIDETEGSTTKFYVDQKFSPVKVVKTEEGELSAVAQFYDMTFANIATLKGGTGSVAGYIPATGYTTVDLATRILLDSGHTLDMYNASVTARITGGGGRDKMFALEAKFIPQLTLDNTGSWKLYPTP